MISSERLLLFLASLNQLVHLMFDSSDGLEKWVIEAADTQQNLIEP